MSVDHSALLAVSMTCSLLGLCFPSRIASRLHQPIRPFVYLHTYFGRITWQIQGFQVKAINIYFFSLFSVGLSCEQFPCHILRTASLLLVQPLTTQGCWGVIVLCVRVWVTVKQRTQTNAANVHVLPGCTYISKQCLIQVVLLSPTIAHTQHFVYFQLS